MESKCALVEQKSNQKAIDQLRSAIEKLILTCIGDQLEEVRSLAFKRLQVFFEKAPLSISAAFCLRWIEEFKAALILGDQGVIPNMACICCCNLALLAKLHLATM
ncbi:unnamed protein product [Hydatigera taeniaeformis]|uniref:GRAS domain-containing protein n=1 Tax=Hydatigena taeniaeformis TaxID=6205 RepID=A0A0R3WV29_HYDTA|nr:unnamed protein product [Hydatigera taeniaeformis]